MHGNVVHLWERDCSMQRRHQKLIEESPAPHLTARNPRGDVRRGRAAGQGGRTTPTPARSSSSSTRQGNFYFIEVNARIQVEHPVTEMVTGIDLIKAQIRVAAGEPLPFTQDDIVPARRGDRVPHQRRRSRARISSPRPGKIERLIVPGGFGVRFDSHAHAGYVGLAPLRFDDRQADRPPADAARGDRLHAAGTRRAAHRGHQDHRSRCIAKILDHAAFVEGRVDTTFVERSGLTQ